MSRLSGTARPFAKSKDLGKCKYHKYTEKLGIFN